MRKTFTAFWGIFLILVVTSFQSLAQENIIYGCFDATYYRITDLGTTPMEPQAINDLGQVVGWGYAADGKHVYVWEGPNEIQDLGVGTGDSEKAGINDSGEVVGSMREVGGFYAFLWDRITGMENLGTLGGSNAMAMDVNNLTQVVGNSRTPNELIRAFLWDTINGMQDLGTLGGSSGAYAVNDNGQVVGASRLQQIGGPTHAFYWDSDEGMLDLGTLGGRFTTARDINNAGDVVGTAQTDDGHSQAFLWDIINGMQTLGGYCSMAFGINDLGQIVGRESNLGCSPYWATIWENGSMCDLNNLVIGGGEWLVLEQATAINNAGQIVGYGMDRDYRRNGFLLTPVHEIGSCISNMIQWNCSDLNGNERAECNHAQVEYCKGLFDNSP